MYRILWTYQFLLLIYVFLILMQCLFLYLVHEFKAGS